MITIKELREFLKQFDDNALAYAYEGEQVGIVVVGAVDKVNLIRRRLGFIEASEGNDPEYDTAIYEAINLT